MELKVRDYIFLGILIFLAGAAFGLLVILGPSRSQDGRIRELEQLLDGTQRELEAAAARAELEAGRAGELNRQLAEYNRRAGELNSEMEGILGRNATTIGEIREIIQALRACVAAYNSSPVPGSGNTDWMGNQQMTED